MCELFILLHQIKHFIALERNKRKDESCFCDSAGELLIRGLLSEVWLRKPSGQTTFSKENENTSTLCFLKADAPVRSLNVFGTVLFGFRWMAV